MFRNDKGDVRRHLPVRRYVEEQEEVNRGRESEWAPISVLCKVIRRISVDYSDSAISADLSVLTISKSSASSLAETLTPDELA